MSEDEGQRCTSPTPSRDTASPPLLEPPCKKSKVDVYPDYKDTGSPGEQRPFPVMLFCVVLTRFP